MERTRSVFSSSNVLTYLSHALIIVPSLEKGRDLNAAENLLCTVSSTGTEACGEERPGFGASRSETILCEAGTGA